MIQLSKAAASEIRRWRSQHQQPEAFLRLGVQPGGCASFAYAIDFDTQVKESDRLFESEGIQIAVDADSSSYLNGIVVDYAEDLMGGGFRFRNPNAKQTCSCGNSFSI